LVSGEETIMRSATLLRAVVFAAVFSCVVGIVGAQERPVPGDSARVAIPGCAKGRAFVVAETPEHEPTQVEIAPGRRFRLSGPKEILNGIKKHEGRLIEVTGLVRKNALKGPGGIGIAGGRVRIGGGSPVASTGDPSRTLQGYEQPVLDVEGYRQLGENCSVK
jgi:hypothetical protein